MSQSRTLPCLLSSAPPSLMHHASDLKMLQHCLFLASIATIPFALLPIVHAAHTICSWSPGPLNPDKYNYTMYCEGKAEKMNMTYYTYGCKRTGRELASWGIQGPGKLNFSENLPCGIQRLADEARFFSRRHTLREERVRFALQAFLLEAVLPPGIVGLLH